MKTVLVIDMLEDFFAKGPLRAFRKDLTGHINTLTEQARERGIPVIWVRQEFRDDLADAFPIMKKENIRITIAGSKGCEILPELVRADDEYEVVKKRYSAFFGTGLKHHLHEIGASELILAGVNTHACIRTAAIDAYQRNFEVTIPVECVASYDLEHHEVTLGYLQGRIANLVQLAEMWNAGAL